MPRYRFNWGNLPEQLLLALCEDLGVGVGSDGPASSLRSEFGARPTDDFMREAWPTLREKWLASDDDSRQWLVGELREMRREPDQLSGRTDEMAYLRALRNTVAVRNFVWGAFVVFGEAGTVGINSEDSPGTASDPVQDQPLVEGSRIPPATWPEEAVQQLIDMHSPTASAQHLKQLVSRLLSQSDVVVEPGFTRDGHVGDRYLRVFDPSVKSPTPVYVNYTGRIDFRLQPEHLEGLEDLLSLPGLITRQGTDFGVRCRLVDESTLSSVLVLVTEALDMSRAS